MNHSLADLPSVAMPESLETALAALRQRQAEHGEAVERTAAARRAVADARQLDLRERAAARDEGLEDPGARHEEEARATLAAAEDSEAVEAQRIATAEQALEQALADGLQAWDDALRAARRRADVLTVKRLDAMRQAETERGQVRATRALVAALTDGTELPYALRKTARPVVGLTDGPDSRNANQPLAMLALLDAIERYLQTSSTEAEDQQAADRIAQAEQDERDRQEIAEYRRHFPGVALPGS
ncbi:MAG: hypothetical protein ACXVRN_04245 [Solirubrobacteraceae bacterium]